MIVDVDQGPESSGTESGHAAAAGQHEPTHHDHHPEPVNESFGVRLLFWEARMRFQTNCT